MLSAGTCQVSLTAAPSAETDNNNINNNNEQTLRLDEQSQILWARRTSETQISKSPILSAADRWIGGEDQLKGHRLVH